MPKSLKWLAVVGVAVSAALVAFAPADPPGVPE